MRNITKKEAKKALVNDAWDLGNQVLYDLCSQYPLHKTHQEIIAKLWLIGRSYSAALERRKNKSADSAGDLFYEDNVAPKIQQQSIDSWIETLNSKSTPEEIIEAHHKLTKVFFDITGLNKRSLASKYLHFHRPDLFFIYDSRAKKAIRKILPDDEKPQARLSPKQSDPEYLNFYRLCLCLRQNLETELKPRKISPRDIDKILLFVADRID